MVDLNKAMYDVLVVGMISSTAIYILGLVLFLTQNYSPLQATVVRYSNVNEFAQQLVAMRSSAVLMLATIVLIATPIARVFLSIVVFAVNRDRKYVLVTGTVFIILIVSITLGYFGHFAPG